MFLGASGPAGRVLDNLILRSPHCVFLMRIGRYELRAPDRRYVDSGKILAAVPQRILNAATNFAG
jgi:hypothetical protein